MDVLPMMNRVLDQAGVVVDNVIQARDKARGRTSRPERALARTHCADR